MDSAATDAPWTSAHDPLLVTTREQQQQVQQQSKHRESSCRAHGQHWAKLSADNLIKRLRHELCAANAEIASLQLLLQHDSGELFAALTDVAGQIRDQLTLRYSLVAPASRNLSTALGVKAVRHDLRGIRQGALLRDLGYIADGANASRHLTATEVRNIADDFRYTLAQLPEVSQLSAGSAVDNVVSNLASNSGAPVLASFVDRLSNAALHYGECCVSRRDIADATTSLCAAAAAYHAIGTLQLDELPTQKEDLRIPPSSDVAAILCAQGVSSTPKT
jgi:hypothetical protein